jgi:hypothetical protein
MVGRFEQVERQTQNYIAALAELVERLSRAGTGTSTPMPDLQDVRDAGTLLEETLIAASYSAGYARSYRRGIADWIVGEIQEATGVQEGEFL